MTIADYNRIFSILVEYQPDAGPEAVYGHNEELQIFVDPELVSDADTERLEDLGAHPRPNSRLPPHFLIHT